MSSRAASPNGHRAASLVAGVRGGMVRDASGFAVFSAGEMGAAHVMAHRMLDRGRYVVGYRLLGSWLAGRDDAGSAWVHLHWHMAVFEIALELWNAALARFRTHILPAAGTEEALTDAPALLWRLSLAAGMPLEELPWENVREGALARMQRPSSACTELHNLLALAGSGDVASLDRWLDRLRARAPSRDSLLLKRMTVALRAYAAGDYAQAASALARTLPYIAEIGGSRAQNELFRQLEQAARDRAAGNDRRSAYAMAA